MTDTRLAKVDSGAVSTRDAAQMDIESIMRYAIEKGMTADAMQGFMVIRRELKAEKAKAAFDAALAAFQAECPIIEKRKAVMNKDGRSVRYKYAPLDDIVSQVKGLLKQHGFSYTLNAEVKDKMVKAICRIKHDGGHEQFSEMEVPVDPEGYMNVQQKYASALTFAKRYAFCNGFGIMTGDEDTDAASEKVQQPGPSALQGSAPATPDDRDNKKKLVDLTRSIHMARGYALDEDAKRKLTQWLIDENVISDTQTVADLSGVALAQAVDKVKQKLVK